VTRRHVPDSSDALGFVGLLLLAVLFAMGLAMLDGSSIPKGFAP
jgi:hypothetical protein